MSADNPNPSAGKPVHDGHGDGTRQLLQWGASILGAGLLAALLLETLLGGLSATGADTNTGWAALIVALTCIPFGGLLTALGLAKWLRNRATTPATRTCRRGPR